MEASQNNSQKHEAKLTLRSAQDIVKIYEPPCIIRLQGLDNRVRRLPIAWLVQLVI